MLLVCIGCVDCVGCTLLHGTESKRAWDESKSNSRHTSSFRCVWCGIVLEFSGYKNLRFRLAENSRTYGYARVWVCMGTENSGIYKPRIFTNIHSHQDTQRPITQAKCNQVPRTTQEPQCNTRSRSSTVSSPSSIRCRRLSSTSRPASMKFAKESWNCDEHVRLPMATGQIKGSST